MASNLLFFRESIDHSVSRVRLNLGPKFGGSHDLEGGCAPAWNHHWIYGFQAPNSRRTNSLRCCYYKPTTHCNKSRDLVDLLQKHQKASLAPPSVVASGKLVIRISVYKQISELNLRYTVYYIICTTHNPACVSNVPSRLNLVSK